MWSQVHAQVSMCRRSSSSRSHGDSMSASRRAGARCGVPAPPYSAPGRARAAPARRHLPPRPPPDSLHHKNRLLARPGAGCAALATSPDCGRGAASRGARGVSRVGAHSEVAGRRLGNAARPGSEPGPGQPGRAGAPSSPPPAAPSLTRAPLACFATSRRTHLSDAQSSTYNCLLDVGTHLHTLTGYLIAD